MRSTIYANDKITNGKHEFGESSDPLQARYFCIFVDEGGRETVLAFTPNEIYKARDRAAREPEDTRTFLERRTRYADGVDVAKVVAALLFVGTVAMLIGWATGLLP